jgi:hypothetical protein
MRIPIDFLMVLAHTLWVWLLSGPFLWARITSLGRTCIAQDQCYHCVVIDVVAVIVLYKLFLIAVNVVGVVIITAQ